MTCLTNPPTPCVHATSVWYLHLPLIPPITLFYSQFRFVSSTPPPPKCNPHKYCETMADSNVFLLNCPTIQPPNMDARVNAASCENLCKQCRSKSCRVMCLCNVLTIAATLISCIHSLQNARCQTRRSSHPPRVVTTHLSNTALTQYHPHTHTSQSPSN